MGLLSLENSRLGDKERVISRWPQALSFSTRGRPRVGAELQSAPHPSLERGAPPARLFAFLPQKGPLTL